MPGVRREQVQQAELLIGELDVAAVDPRRGARARSMSMPWMRTGGPAVASSPSSARRRRFARTPQQRARARDQLADAERLGQVVVGAALEADAPCPTPRSRAVSIRIGTSPVHAAAAHGAAQRHAVEAGQHHVEHQQVEALGLGRA